ncbi:MAG: winged helix-turn-helix domain-containing protein, partial [Gemmatimonadaceae bacterium]
LLVATERHTLRRGDRDLPLTPLEVAVLAYRAAHAGRVVSRAELMEHVWDDHPDRYSNIIDVYASRLRRKLDEGETVALFTTVRGVGFLLEAPA